MKAKNPRTNDRQAHAPTGVLLTSPTHEAKGFQKGMNLHERKKSNPAYRQAIADNLVDERCNIHGCNLPLQKKEVGWHQGSDLIAPQPLYEVVCPVHGHTPANEVLDI